MSLKTWKHLILKRLNLQFMVSTLEAAGPKIIQHIRKASKQCKRESIIPQNINSMPLISSSLPLRLPIGLMFSIFPRSLKKLFHQCQSMQREASKKFSTSTQRLIPLFLNFLDILNWRKTSLKVWWFVPTEIKASNLDKE